MGEGLARAFSEITLVVFTTIGPSGAVAFVGICMIVLWGDLPANMKKTAGDYLGVPIAIALVGLVASATHLGNPANALYVLAGVGRSPLSNEVVSGLIFLVLGALTWLLGFGEKERRRLRNILMCAASAAALVFVGMVAHAYSVRTVPTWNLPLLPLAQWTCALAGGSYLVLTVLYWAQVQIAPRYRRWVIICGSCSSLASILMYGIVGYSLPAIENAWISASDLAPYWNLFLCASFVLQAASLVMSVGIPVRGRSIVLPTLASILCLLGIFLIRFLFYSIHMTAGF